MSVHVEPWSDDRLDALRQLGDAELDPLLDAVRRWDPASVLALFDRFVRAQLEIDPAQHWPAELVDWWHHPPSRPQWVNQEQIDAGIRFSERWLPEIATSYLIASLPTAYAAGDGAKALIRISLLRDPGALWRRVLETLRFSLRVDQRGALDVGGVAYILARKVRVFHALVRVMVADFHVDRRQQSGFGAEWDSAQLGAPVNQEDLLGTLWTFSLTPIEMLERSGVRIAAAEKDAVVHQWCAVGELLGIPSGTSGALLPMTYADASHCWERIQQHQLKPSDEGKELTGLLLDRCRRLVPLPILRDVPIAAVYDAVGPTTAEKIGVPRGGPVRYVLPLSRALFRLSLRIPGGRLLRAPLRHMLKRFVMEWLRDARAGDRAPRALAAEQQRLLVPFYVTPTARRAARAAGDAPRSAWSSRRARPQK